MGKEKKKKTYLDVGQPLVSDRGQDMAKNGDTKEDDIGLPGAPIIGQANAILVLEEIQSLDQKPRGSKNNRQRDGDLPGHIAPAAHPGRDATAPGRRERVGLVINTTGRGID